jgi:hypothetical protein
MPVLPIDPVSSGAHDPRLALLRAWLSLGVLGLVLLPPSEWHNAWVGWLPYWLLIAPSISLGLLHRHRLAAALVAFLVCDRRRRSAFRRGGGIAVPRPRALRRELRPAAEAALIPR